MALSPELALNFSAGSTRSNSSDCAAYDIAAHLAKGFVAVEETAYHAHSEAQKKRRRHSAGVNFMLLTLGRYLAAARMKLRRHSTPPPKPLNSTEKDHFWSIEAPIIALAVLHEFGSEAHARATQRADGARRAGDLIAAKQWRRIAQIIRHEEATAAELRASVPSSQSGSPQRRLGRWRASHIH